MENYKKEPSHIEHQVDDSPFQDPQHFHIEVPKEKSVKTMVNRGLKNFGPGKPIVWYASGRSISKVISCAEIMKTYYKKPLYQITKVNQMRTIETWDAVADGLDSIRVIRSVPMIYILLSLEQLDVNSKGYQKCRPREKSRSIQLSELTLSLEEESLSVSPTPKVPPSSPLGKNGESPSI